MPYALGFRRLLLASFFLTLTLTPLRADEAPSWPTYGELLKQAKPGEFIKYKEERTGDGRRTFATVWADYKGTEAGKAAFDMTTSSHAKTPWQAPTESGVGVQRIAHTEDLASGYMDAVPPAGSKIGGNVVTATPFKDERIGDRVLSGTKYERSMRVQTPARERLMYKVELWVSPDLPATGVAQYRSMVSNGREATSTTTQTLLAASDMDPTAGQAEAHEAAVAALEKTAEAKLSADATANQALRDAVTTMDAALAYSEAAAKEGYKVTEGWTPKYDDDASALINYRSRLGTALLAMGRYEAALAQSADLPGNRMVAGSHLKALMAEAAHRDDTAAVATLTKQLKSRERSLSDLKTEWYILNPTPSTSADLIAHLRTLNDPKAMDRGLRDALSRLNEHLNAAQRGELLAALNDDTTRAAFMKSALLSVVEITPDLAAFEGVCAASPAFKATPEYQEMRLVVLAQTADHQDEAKGLLEAYLKREDKTLSRTAIILEALGDARAAGYRRSANKELAATYDTRFAELKDGAKPWESQVITYIRTMAALGDRKAAEAAAKTYALPINWQTWVAPVVALYGEGGDKPGAIAWRNAFKATGPSYWVLGMQVEMTLGFAEWELKQGNGDAYTTLLDQSVAAAAKTNHLIVAANAAETDGRKRVSWRVDTGSSQAPYVSVAKHLVAQRDTARLLAFLPQLRDESPTLTDAESAWETSAKGLAAQGDHESLAKLLVAAPGAWSDNWYTAMLGESVALVAADAGAAWVRQLADGLAKPHWKAEVLRAGIIALADADKLADAQALFDPLAALVKSGVNNTSQAYAALALACGHVRAGNLAEGLAAYRQRVGSLAEGSAIKRGYNGRDGDEVLQGLGRALAKQSTPPAAAAWLEATENLKERATLALGIAEGLQARGE